jgi:hypothetical protein
LRIVITDPRKVAVMLAPRKRGQAAAHEKLLQGLDADFFEKDDVVVAVILQADPTFVGAAAALRFEIKFAFGDRLALGVVGDLLAI